MGNACLQSMDEAGCPTIKDSSFDPDTIPPVQRRSSVTLDDIRPLLAQGRHSQKLELILVMVGEKHERCVIPRTEVRRLCKKHRALKAKINHVVRRLRELNATLLEALPVDNTEWAIVNGEFDILQEGAQDASIREFNVMLADLKVFIAAAWDARGGPGTASTNLFSDTAAMLHMSLPSPVAATPTTQNRAKSKHVDVFTEELAVMSHSLAREAEDKAEIAPTTAVVQENLDSHKWKSSWGLVTWRPHFRSDTARGDIEPLNDADRQHFGREHWQVLVSA
ncbi:hypothetical protein DYB37_010871 [Aphanomyces astaci]|uniref:Uncharacterized protein n=1 Tax=Aphanomyces astaci TaxID=112090 RepID=A0A3R7AQG4_APHAT|nr:hypothetical protein DYB37_010871 [Aphanomyces astaci]